MFLPLVGAAVMMLIPRAEEDAHKVVALLTSLATLGHRRRDPVNFDYDHSGKLQFVRRTSSGST